MFTKSLRSVSLLSLTLGLAAMAGTAQAQAPTVIFSNTTNFLGQAFANGGAQLQSGNTITTLVADDITFAPGSAGASITGFVFSVANLNAAAVSARPRVRFYAADGTNGAPGTYLTGFSFNPISFGVGVGTYNYNPGTALFTVPTNNTIWAGMTFDNNTGATGATAAQLNNLGQGLFDPPTVGSSQNAFFQTTAAGAFVGNNPAGTIFTFGATGPVANFGWQFSGIPVAAPEPGLMLGFSLVFGVGSSSLLARRRKSRAAA